MYQILEKCPLFLGLTANEIESLLKDVYHRINQYGPNVMIAQSGEEIVSQLIVLEGSVKGEMIDFSGKTIKIEDIGSPRPLAPAFLFGHQNKYPVNIVSNEKTSILSIPKSSFIKMMMMNEKVLNNFLSIVSNRAQFLSGKIKFLSFQSIKGKIAHYLLQQSKRHNTDEVILEKSQAQLAELFGVTRPSLGRAIREMDQAGVIEARAKNIRLIDKVRLSALLK